MIRVSIRANCIKCLINYLPQRRFQAIYWFTKIFGPHRRFIGKFHNGLLEINPKDPASKSAFYFGFYEKETTIWFLDQIKNKKITFLDVGANFGYFSFLATSYAKVGSKIIAFEPDPHSRSWLQRNKEINKAPIIIEPYAISSSKGEVEFLSCSSDQKNALWSRVQLADAPQATLVENAQNIKVKSISLDEYLFENEINQVDILKIDIEGAEGYAIDGMKESLRKKVYKSVFIEFHSWAIPSGHSVASMVKAFTDNGYRAFRLKTSYMTKEKDKDPRTYILDKLSPDALVPVKNECNLNEIKDWEHFVFTL